MSYQLPELPYKFDALEPYIDAQTMEIHHDKHHAGYVNKLNAALEGHDNLAKLSIEELLQKIDDVPEEIRQSVINNGGGHANHSLFWKILSPEESEPTGKFLDALNAEFASFDGFKEKFTEKALSLFGSGWVFLQVGANGKLSLKRHSFQNSPYMHGNIPVLGLDVWEHAYYLKYQNKRAEYVEAFWNIINWKEVENNFNNATSR